MGKLFRFEIRKVFRTPAFYLFISLLSIVLFLVALGNRSLFDHAEQMRTTSGFAFSLNAFTNCLFVYVIAVYVAIFFCQDVHLGTIKNIYGKGFSRAQVFFTKYLTSLAIVLFMAGTIYALSLAFGFAFLGRLTTLPDRYGQIILCQFLTIIGYHAIYTLLTVSIPRLAAAMPLNVLAPLAILLILVIIDDQFYDYENMTATVELSKYWIANFFERLTYSVSDEPLNVARETLLTVSIGSISYTVISVVLAFFIHRKKDC